MTGLQLFGIFSSILVYECIRMLLGNYRMRQQGVDFESLIANFKHIATHGSFTANNKTPWLSSTFSSSTMVGIMRQFYLINLILCSAIGLILCQYTADSLFRWINNGSVFAVQLMPEAKLLVDSAGSDHQPFAGNYFSFSVGLGITMIISILYALIFKSNQKQGGSLQGIKCLIIFIFVTVTSLSFLKPYLHMSSSGSTRVDKSELWTQFNTLPAFTASFGLAFGILAYSTILSQMTSVPELLVNEANSSKRDESPYHEYFKLPLFLANFFGLLMKCCFAISGAMMMKDDSNLFEGLIFSKQPVDAVLVMMAIFCVFIILPNSIDL